MSGRYWWLRLQASFFDSDEVRALESQANGKAYIVIWLKVLLKAIQQEEPGVMRFKDAIPYTPALLASILKEDIDQVSAAMKAFQALGLIVVKENGDIWVEEAKRMVGSESDSAPRMRRLREREKESSRLLEVQSEPQTPKKKVKVPAESSEAPGFEEFWETFPNKSEKISARAKWSATIKKGATAEQLITAGKNYAAMMKAEGRERKFIKQGKTFLGDKEPWRDYLNGQTPAKTPLEAYEALHAGER